MTDLLVDLGNSRCKVALCDAGSLSAIASFAAADREPLQAYLAGHVTRGMPTTMSSVAGERVTTEIVASVQSVTEAAVHLLDPTDELPLVRNGYRKPHQLGIDRLMAMIAARASTSGPLCVVDAGTAVTIDLVAADGEHLGGFILPGSRLARDCLLARTSIPSDSDIDPTATLGRDTPTAVALAARYAVIGIVEQFSRGPHAPFDGEPVSIVVGGGGADDLLPLLPPGCITLPDLVLQGLAVVAGQRGD
jgi:type III pantothenate kinase